MATCGHPGGVQTEFTIRWMSGDVLFQLANAKTCWVTAGSCGGGVGLAGCMSAVKSAQASSTTPCKLVPLAPLPAHAGKAPYNQMAAAAPASRVIVEDLSI